MKKLALYFWDKGIDYIMDYFKMYADIWTLHKKYIEQVKTNKDNDNFWNDVLFSFELLRNKYDNCRFITHLITNELQEFNTIANAE